jgi:beta-lactam-binding protein with PASTA domain
MVVVALISAFVAMRLAIHGREAVVPPLMGLTVAEASSAVGHQGLHLTVENRFYSSEVPAGHVIAQDPAAGFRVRSDWPVRITESLGSQRVPIPNLVGQSERAAVITIRQLGLELGAVVHLPAPGPLDVVIGQNPSPDAGEMTSPGISLVVSDPEAAGASYVMPSLVGLTYSAAAVRVEAAGLHVVAADEPPIATVTPAPAPATPNTPAAPDTGAQATTPVEQPTSGIVVAQSPLAGYRVQQGDTVHITLSHAGLAE